MRSSGSEEGSASALVAGVPILAQTSRGPIEYVGAGEGPAVLALHGGMGGYDQGLLLARAAFADMDAFRVIAVSRPGYLGTPFGEARTPEQQADLYAALFDRLGISTALVIAVSAGGPSALQFALRHPSRCAGLILVSACSGRLDIPPEVAARLPVMKLMARLPWLTGIMRWLSNRNPARRARRSIRDEAVLNRTLAHPQAGPMMHALHASAMSRLAQRLPGTLNDIAQFAAMPPMPLSQIRAPTLVMHGTGDRAVPFVHGKRVADEAPHAGLMAVDGGEHVAIFTHLDDIRARVRLFVERLARPAGLS